MNITLKRTIVVICLGLSFVNVKAQTQQSAQCGTVTPPVKWETSFSSKVKDYKNRTANRTAITSYTIPVIVHILHDGDNIGENENISWAQVKSQIDILNADFSGNNLDIVNVPLVFQSVKSGNTGIQFCLAKTDPEGNVLNEEGVDRINWQTRGWDDPTSFWLANSQNFKNYFNTTIKPESIWDPKKYLNVWLSSKNILLGILGFGLYPTGVGFSELPSAGDGIETSTTSGVWMHHERWGNIGTVNSNPFNSNRLGRVATHEIGHWLGVYHTFESFPYSNGCYGQGNCDLLGDRCCDTPPQSVENSGCPSNQSSCIEVPIDTIDMYMNYMDYTNDQCRIMFTKDQVVRMQTTMANGAFRSTLNASTACQICPELVIISPSASSYNVTDSVTISFVEKNKGSSNAVPNYVNIHLSTDNILTPGLNGDIYLGQLYIDQTLSPNTQTSLLSKHLTIPTSVSPGIYYLIIAADGTEVVNECVEDNNFATAIISVSNTSSSTQASYRYWFDNSFVNAINVNGSFGTNYTVQSNIPTTSLQQGLHTFTVGFKDINQKWSSFVSSFFYKSNTPAPAGSARYEYWFDNYYPSRAVRQISSTSNLIVLDNLALSNLASGLHTLSARFKPDGRHWSSVTSSFFYKSDITTSGTAQYEYWFDNNYQNKAGVNNSSTSNLILLDSIPADSLTNGLHTFNIRFRSNGKTWSSATSSFFYKTEANLTAGQTQYEYWFDNAYNSKITTNNTSTNNFLLLENVNTSALINGLHTLHIRFRPDGRTWSSATSSFFYKDGDAIVPINNLAKYVYWYDNNWQSPKTITITGVQNISWTLNTDASELAVGTHALSMMFKDDRGKWSSIVSSSFTRSPIAVQPCATGNRQFVAGVAIGPNATFQWQVNNGTGFENISNNTTYLGTNNDTLQLTGVPTSWYGYKYRCLVTNGSNTITGTTYILKFTMTWNGSVSNDWENPANWSCNALPDANTDVYINASMPRYPNVNTNVSCRSLNLQPATSINIKPGIILTITGKE